MALIASSEKERTIEALLSRAAIWTACAVGAMAVAIAAVAPLQPLTWVGGIALGAVTFGALIFSLRHYTWLWWLCWIVPIVPFVALWKKMEVGEVSMFAGLFPGVLAVALTFGAFVLLKGHVRKWTA
jgi:hypothetical protein